MNARHRAVLLLEHPETLMVDRNAEKGVVEGARDGANVDLSCHDVLLRGRRDRDRVVASSLLTEGLLVLLCSKAVRE